MFRKGKDKQAPVDCLIAVLLYCLWIGLLSIAKIDSSGKDIVLILGQLLFGSALFLLFGTKPDKPSFDAAVLPFCLLPFLNLIVIGFQGAELGSLQKLVLSLFSAVGAAFAEEMHFRGYIYDEMEGYRPLTKILFSSALFGLAHLLNGFSLASLIQVGYTFVLGLFLGAIRLSKLGLTGCFIFHFLFNFLMDGLFVYLGGEANGLPFYLVNLVGGALLLGYWVYLAVKGKWAKGLV